jgi:hypothetical protein
MPSTEGYPFRRLFVDHMIIGVSRISWELDRQFNGLLPYSFQLQVGNTGNQNAVDWVNVGTPGVNTLYAEDDERREGNYGKQLLTHYRVLLTTDDGHKYVSRPVHTFGELGEKDWVFAREIVRKEKLRHQLVSVEGFLLKRMRFGIRCTNCLDPLTGGITNSNCPECNGVGFQVGYHPPSPLTFDMKPEVVEELLKGTEPPGPSAYVGLHARLLGFPPVAKHDVWVDGKSDQRWIMHTIGNMAEWRHVPLVVDVEINLLPFTDPVYKIPVDDASLPDDTLPNSGNGDTCIDQDYGGTDNMAYVDSEGNAVVGATILAFNKADYDAGARSPSQAVASSSTTAGGRWTFQMCLCCGRDYVLVFEKAGCFGPDVLPLSLPCANMSSSSSSFFSSSSIGP